MNYYFSIDREDVIKIIIDNGYTIRTFEQATDIWKHYDGAKTKTDLSNRLAGNTDRANKIVRLNKKLPLLRMVTTLFHELNHVISKEPEYLEQEIQVRINT